MPVARAANTGISAMIDARGRVTASLPLNRAGAILAPLPPAIAPPPYARWGDGPAAAGVAPASAGRPDRPQGGLTPGPVRPRGDHPRHNGFLA